MTLKKLKEELRQLLLEAARNTFDLEEVKVDICRNKKIGYGDFSSTVAFSLNKKLALKPIEIATKIVEGCRKSHRISQIEVTPPGFINIYLQDQWKLEVLEAMQWGDLQWNINLHHQFIKDEMAYIAYRTNWVLSVFQQEGIYPEISQVKVADIRTPLEEVLINQMLDWLELMEEVDEDKIVKVLESMTETFHKYHNTLDLRNLEDSHRNIVLSLFKVVSKIMGVGYSS